jgi:hypothetical protein
MAEVPLANCRRHLRQLAGLVLGLPRKAVEETRKQCCFLTTRWTSAVVFFFDGGDEREKKVIVIRLQKPITTSVIGRYRQFVI